MFSAQKHSKGSLVALVIIILAVIVALGYFGISVKRDIVDNPTVEENTGYVWGKIKYLWDNYLKDAAIKVWDWAFINLRNLPLGTGNQIQVPGVEMPTSTAPY